MPSSLETDGGLGAHQGAMSDPVSTAHALWALTTAGKSGESAAAGMRTLLASWQESDGYWSSQRNGAGTPDLLLSALCVAALAQSSADAKAAEPGTATALAKGSAWLASQRGSDGSWGGADIALTAFCVSALSRTTRSGLLAQSAEFLASRQAADGSFGSGVFETAAAVKALRAWESSPVPPPPDLAVAASDIAVTPSSPVSGDSMSVEVVARNIGEGSAAKAVLRLFLSGDGVDEARLGPDFTFDSIDAGSSATASVTGLILPAGSFTIRAVVDPDGLLMESDEENNTASAALSVGSRPLSDPDLAVTASDVTAAPGSSSSPELITIAAIIRNRGETTAANVVVRFLDGKKILGEARIDKVFGLGEASVSLTAALPTGMRTIVVMADPDDLIAESNEENNNAELRFEVENAAPSAPTGLSAVPGDTRARLAWTPNTEGDSVSVSINGAQAASAAAVAGLPRTSASGSGGILSSNPADYNSKLKAYWTFNENTGSAAVDSINGASASFNYSATWAEGISGSGVLAGYDWNNNWEGYVTTNIRPASTSTISYWFKGSSSYGSDHIYFYYSGEAGYFGCFTAVDSNGRYQVSDMMMGNFSIYDSSHDYRDGLWHHVALVFDGTGNCALHIDGQYKGMDSFSYYDWSTATYSSPVYLGTGMYGGGVATFDELAIWDTVLPRRGDRGHMEQRGGKILSGSGHRLRGILDHAGEFDRHHLWRRDSDFERFVRNPWQDFPRRGPRRLGQA